MHYKTFQLIMVLSVAWHVFLIRNVSAQTSEEEYSQVLAETNAYLALGFEQDNCPNGTIALHCGDEVCAAFENTSNCPEDCVPSKLKSYNNQLTCPNVQQIYAPHNVSDVQSIINEAKNQGVPVRVVGSVHSVNEQICSDGFIISTQNLDGIIGIKIDDKGNEYVVVEPAVTMGELSEWLHKNNRSLGFHVLGFRLPTVAGAIATGAHGSSLNHSAVISSAVHAITLVTSDGLVREITEDDGDYVRAARAHLGMLGVVVNITLKIEPQFRLHVQVSHHKADGLSVGQGLYNQVKDCDYALINWFPLQNRFLKTCGKKTMRAADLDAENILLKTNIPPGISLPFKLALHYGHCFEWLNHSLESLRYHFMVYQPFFQKRFFLGGIIRATDLVGYSHRLMSSEFDAADQHFFQDDWELAVPLSQIDGAMRFVSKHAHDNGLHWPLIGVFLRFAPSEDTTLLAHSTSVGAFSLGEPVVFMEFPTPSLLGFPDAQRKAIEQKLIDMVTTLITHYHARPHWGKNALWTFLKQKDLNAYGDNYSLFKTIAADLDPQGMFSNAFFQEIGLGH